MTFVPVFHVKGYLFGDEYTGSCGLPEDFTAGTAGKFQYKTRSSIVGETHTSGFFMFMGPDRNEVKIKEEMNIRIDLAKGTVEGSGKNVFGTFDVKGTFNPSSRKMDLIKTYAPQVIAAAPEPKKYPAPPAFRYEGLIKPKPTEVKPKPVEIEIPDDYLPKPKAQRDLCFQEIRQLGEDIQRVPDDKMTGIIEIVKNGGVPCEGEGEVELDLEVMDPETLRSLQKYVRNCLRDEKRKAVRSGIF